MKAFEDGERVRFVGVEGLHTKWTGREGVVTDSYRDFDGNRAEVRFDGETKSVSFDEDDLEAVKSTYDIEMSAEASISVYMELTDAEAELLGRLVAAFKAEAEGPRKDFYTYAPTIEMKKENK